MFENDRKRAKSFSLSFSICFTIIVFDYRYHFRLGLKIGKNSKRFSKIGDYRFRFHPSASQCLGFQVLHSFNLIRKCKRIPEGTSQPKSPIQSKAARQTTSISTHKGELFSSSVVKKEVSTGVRHTNISRDAGICMSCVLESPRGLKVLIIDCEMCKIMLSGTQSDHQF